MRNKRRDFPVKILALFVAAMLTAGCAAAPAAPVATTAAATTAAAAPTTTAAEAGAAEQASSAAAPAAFTPQEVYDISIYTSRNQPNPNSDVMKKINELLGVNLEVTAVPDSEYRNKLNLYFSSGDMPDIFTCYNDPTMMRGACAEITEEEIQTYMPLAYEAGLKQYEMLGTTKEAVFSKAVLDGKLTGFTIGQVSQSFPYGVRIRQDIVDELGLGMPELISEWDTFLAAYKERYPDVYPITARGKDLYVQNFYLWFCAYGTSMNAWHLKDDDTLEFGPFVPTMRDALLKLKEWYDMGYINPEFITMDAEALRNEWKRGNTVYFQFSHLGSAIEPPFSPGGDEEQLMANVPTAKLAWAPFPKDTPERKPSVQTGTGLSAEYTNFGIHLEENRDELYTAMMVMDRLFCDFDIFMLRRYGFEGVHYTYDEDGMPVDTSGRYGQTDAQIQAGISWLVIGQIGSCYDIERRFHPEHQTKNVDEFVNTPDGMYSPDRIVHRKSLFTGVMENGDGEDLSKLSQSYQDEFASMHVQVIIGEKTIEDFDSFLERWWEGNAREMTEVATRMYQEQKS